MMTAPGTVNNAIPLRNEWRFVDDPLSLHGDCGYCWSELNQAPEAYPNDNRVIGHPCNTAGDLHTFHFQCIKTWASLRGKCPSCSQHVRVEHLFPTFSFDQLYAQLAKISQFWWESLDWIAELEVRPNDLAGPQTIAAVATAALAYSFQAHVVLNSLAQQVASMATGLFCGLVSDWRNPRQDVEANHPSCPLFRRATSAVSHFVMFPLPLMAAIPSILLRKSVDNPDPLFGNTVANGCFEGLLLGTAALLPLSFFELIYNNYVQQYNIGLYRKYLLPMATMSSFLGEGVSSKCLGLLLLAHLRCKDQHSNFQFFKAVRVALAVSSAFMLMGTAWALANGNHSPLVERGLLVGAAGTAFSAFGLQNAVA